MYSCNQMKHENFKGDQNYFKFDKDVNKRKEINLLKRVHLVYIYFTFCGEITSF